MSQISPPIRILLVAVIGLVAVYMLFLRPKAERPLRRPPRPAATPVPAKDPGAATASKPGAIVQKAVGDTNAASAQAKVAAGEDPGGLAADDTAVRRRPPTAAVPATGAPRPTSAPVTKETLAAPPEGRPRRRRGSTRCSSCSSTTTAPPTTAPSAARSRTSTLTAARSSSTPTGSSTSRRYQAITRGVDVEQSPTIVVADRNLKAETLVGYVDTETIDQAVVDALRASGGSLISDPYFRQLDARLRVGRAAGRRRSRQPASAAALPAYLAARHAVSVGHGDARPPRSSRARRHTALRTSAFKSLQRRRPRPS